jgi:acyl-coenzyme A synthetase/AMP-(fatty) acid ligase
VTNGYSRDSEATSAKFADGWLKTGDLGTLNEQGFLTISGRSDSFIKIRGLRVSLGEVEAIAQQLPEVQEAAACGVSHAQLGEAVALFLVLSPQSTVPTALATLRKSFPAHWGVERLFAVDELPKTSNNKINRVRLQELAERAA